MFLVLNQHMNKNFLLFKQKLSLLWSIEILVYRAVNVIEFIIIYFKLFSY